MTPPDATTPPPDATCEQQARFRVERSDGDPTYMATETCEVHLAETVASLMDGDDKCQAVVTVHWDGEPAITCWSDVPAGPAPGNPVPAEATTAAARAVQAYEPEATGAVIANPGHLLSVLLEASRRGLAAAAPHITAAQRFIIVWRDERDELCRTPLLAVGDSRIGIPVDAFCADLLAAAPGQEGTS